MQCFIVPRRYLFELFQVALESNYPEGTGKPAAYAEMDLEPCQTFMLELQNSLTTFNF